MIHWITLIIAGFCECSFTFCLGKAKEVQGTSHILWLGGFVLFSILSMYLLARVTKYIPIGTAYPVWTGIGAVGTVLIGIFIFNEPTTFWRIFFITTLIISIVGLKIVSA